MNFNHDVETLPKEENYLNGTADDIAEDVDCGQQYQKSCTYLKNNTEPICQPNTLSIEKTTDIKINLSDHREENFNVKSISDERIPETAITPDEQSILDIQPILDKQPTLEVSKPKENDEHSMEPDVSITVGESNLDKTINHVAKGIESQSEPDVNLPETNKVIAPNIVKKKRIVNRKRNHIKVPLNRNIKKKPTVLKLKNGKYIQQKTKESLPYPTVQTNIKFRCYKCSKSEFSSLSELQIHQKKCLNGSQDLSPFVDTSSFNSSSTSTNYKITRKVYLCSACGSYYENWNLFLHMKEMHKRHICLYCLGMFSQPDKLAQHLHTKHNVIEQNLSSTDEFLKLYRGTCYLICCSCEGMFSEQEEFSEHSCNGAGSSSVTEDIGPCPLCGLQGAHFPTCRRAFSDRYVDFGSSNYKSHPALGKKLTSKKKKTKTNKRPKEVFRIVNSENNGEISMTVRKQNISDEFVNESRVMDSSKDESESVSPLRNSTEDIVSTKQYNEKMLQLYRPNKPPEKITSSIQSIEDSINRVIENLALGDEDEEVDTNLNQKSDDNEIKDETTLPEEPPNNPPEELNESLPSEEVKEAEEKPESEPNFQPEPITNPNKNEMTNFNSPVHNEDTTMLSDNESTDSEKLTIAFDQPPDKNDEPEQIVDSVCDKPDDGIPTAGSETPYIYVNLKEECTNVKALIRELVKESGWNCVYCAHAKRIAVNGKQLALHLLAEHRYVTVWDDATEEDKSNSCTSIVKQLKDNLSNLENLYFNTDTFDSEDKSFWKPNDRIYECFHCLFATYVHKELCSHNRKMHQKSVFLCIMCKSNFYNYSELLCHLCPGIYIPGSVINTDITYRCFQCDVDPLPSLFRLMVHLRRKHNSCDICFDVSSNQFQLSTHVWKHKLSHMCYRCGIAYRNKPDITKHLFWKHGTESVLCKKCLQKKWPHVYHFCVPPLSFTCDECSYSLKSAVALKVHKRLHSGEFPYSCDKCDEKFISRKLLTKHLNKHEEELNPPVEIQATEPEPRQEEESQLEEETKAEEKLNGDVEEPEEVEKKPEKEKKSKKKKILNDLFDLPPVNLSESDDSDSDIKPKEVRMESPIAELPITNGYLNGDIGDEVPKEDLNPAEIVDGIWNNFQNYLVNKDPMKACRAASPFKNMSLSRIKQIMLSDHDYFIPNNSQDLNSSKEGEKSSDLDHDYCNNNSKSKSPGKSRQKTRRKEEGDKSSSSESSSDSDSSCSCGSNCSCSSGSSSSSSDDSDSDSRKKEKEKKKSPEETAVADEVEPEPEPQPEVDISVHDAPNEPTIRDSDLETTETETDEDFYDYNPSKEANRILAEKRIQLLANLNGSDAALSSPSTPAEKPKPQKRKAKAKKKRSQSRVNSTKTPRANRKKAPSALTFNSITNEYNGVTSTPNHEVPPPQILSRLKEDEISAKSPTDNSKRPKRKRVPLRFYGFSSDDENDSGQTTKKREKVEHDSTPTHPPAALPAATPPEPTAPESYPRIWNPHSKNSLSYRVEKSDGALTPKVNPIKIRTSQTRQNSQFATNSEVLPVRIKKPERFQLNGNGRPAPGVGVFPGAMSSLTGQKNEKLYCFCQCPYDEVSEMIGCDAKDCAIEWFHFECVGIMVAPKGSWFCPDCKKKLAAESEFLSPPPSVAEQNTN